MRIYIKRDRDEKLFNDAIKEANSIIQESNLENIGVKNHDSIKNVKPHLQHLPPNNKIFSKNMLNPIFNG
ncbi:hypothetical protein LCGC14_0525820 [marine sediment metagenome]|uniref:Uncharacterized protein n=1 Tax=marine sediment metagenome TaxID=412755 RepID=A0A0F9S1U2_9ZZZZ|nr:hypothetical protein [bacterium]